MPSDTNTPKARRNLMKYFEATRKSNKGEGSLNQDCSSASPEHLFDMTITSYHFKIK